MLKPYAIRCRRVALIAATLLLSMSATQIASADAFTMTWTGGDGPGSATLTATPDGTDEWLVSSLVGMQNGIAISLDPSYAGADDIIYQPTDTWFLDNAGIGFTDGTNDYDIFSNPNHTSNYFECNSAVDGACSTAAEGDSALKLTGLNIAPSTSAVPEPTTLPVALIALAIVTLRRRGALEP